jgi:WD40 repeat protein
VRLWKTASGQEVGRVHITAPTDRASIRALALSPDGRTLATGHADGTILLWDAPLGA